MSVYVSPSILDEEDSSFLLRELETTAFSTVVSAMRAQGVLTRYKQVVLDNLKSALFISDEQYKYEMRRAANDEHLQRIAELLNPSYDTFTDWAVVGLDAEEDCIAVPQPRWFDQGTTLSAADDLLSLANQHNQSMTKNDAALLELLKLPNQPYVPERLRLFIRDSETIHTSRIMPLEQDITETAVLRTPKAAAKPRRRKGKATNDVVKNDVLDGQPHDAIQTVVNLPEKKEPKISSQHSGPPLLSPQKSTSESTIVSECFASSISSKEAESLGVKEFLNKIQQQIQEEARSGVPEVVRRKRKPKTSVQKDMLGGFDCARARPFLFESQVNGVKPPRGNPDKRLPKRSPNTSSSICFSPPPQSPSTSSSSLVALSSLPSGVPPIGPPHEQLSPSTSCSSTGVSPIVLPLKEGISLPPRKVSCSAAPNVIPGLLPSSISSPKIHMPGTPSIPNLVYKRPRVGSFTDSVPSSSNAELHTRPHSNILKLNRSSFTTASNISPVNSGKVKFYPPESISSVTSAYGNPTRTYYGNPSVAAAALNRNHQLSQFQARSAAGSGVVPVAHHLAQSTSAASVISTVETIDYGSDGIGVMNNTMHGHDYNSSRPLMKRSIFKTHHAGVRMSNGMGGSGSSPLGPTRLPSSSPTLPSAQVPSPHGPSSPSTSSSLPAQFPVVRRILPASTANQNPQMPVGQFLMRKTNSAQAPDPSPPPAKRLLYDHSARNSPSAGDAYHGFHSGEYSANQAHTAAGGIVGVVQGSGTTRSHLDHGLEKMRPVMVLPAHSSSYRISRSNSQPPRDPPLISIGASLLAAQANPRVIAAVHQVATESTSQALPNYESSEPAPSSPVSQPLASSLDVDEQFEPLQAMDNQPPEPSIEPVRTPLSPAPTLQAVQSSVAEETLEESEESQQQPAPDILQQSMMEIS